MTIARWRVVGLVIVTLWVARSSAALAMMHS